MRDALHEVAVAARRLRSVPIFAATIILTLAVGIGSSTLVFSLVETLLFRPLRYAPSDLVLVTPPVPTIWWGIVDQVREARDVFDAVEVYYDRPANVRLKAHGTERVLVAQVTANFLPLVGVRPALGRSFSPDEFLPGRGLVVMITDAYWHRRFGASRDAIGQMLRVDGRAHTIVGVLPPEFRTLGEMRTAAEHAFDVRVAALAPLCDGRPVEDSTSTGDSVGGMVIGRLKRGVSLTRARALVTAAASRTLPKYADVAFSAAPLRQVLAGQVSRQSVVLSAAVAALLMVACLNVVNLLLQRLHHRRGEFALRDALGASSARLVREVATETLLLGGCGGVVALLFVYGGMRAITAVASRTIARLDELTIDGSVLAFAVVTSIVVGLVVGLLAAARLRAADAARNLHAAPTAPERRTRLAVPSTLVIAQVAMSVILTISAAFLAREFSRSLALDLGYRTDGILTAEISLDPTRYSGPGATRFFDTLLERLRAQPAADATALAAQVPGGRFFGYASGVRVEGGAPTSMPTQTISEDFFSLLGVPLLAGRAFTRDDTARSAPVLMVNAAFARKYWDGPSAAIGRTVIWGTPMTVIGVMADARDRAAGWAKQPTIYFNFRQEQTPRTRMTLLVHGRATREMVPLVAQIVREIDPDQAVYNVVTLDDIAHIRFAPQRLMLMTMVMFAAVTLLMAAIGVHGVMAYAVGLRRQEIGVRLALGGTAGSVTRLMLRRAATLVASGVVIGLPVAIALGLYVQSEVFDFGGSDLVLALAATGVVCVAGLAASLPPALRAARFDPMVILKTE